MAHIVRNLKGFSGPSLGNPLYFFGMLSEPSPPEDCDLPGFKLRKAWGEFTTAIRAGRRYYVLDGGSHWVLRRATSDGDQWTRCESTKAAWRRVWLERGDLETLAIRKPWNVARAAVYVEEEIHRYGASFPDVLTTRLIDAACDQTNPLAEAWDTLPLSHPLIDTMNNLASYGVCEGCEPMLVAAECFDSEGVPLCRDCAGLAEMKASFGQPYSPI